MKYAAAMAWCCHQLPSQHNTIRGNRQSKTGLRHSWQTDAIAPPFRDKILPAGLFCSNAHDSVLCWQDALNASAVLDKDKFERLDFLLKQAKMYTEFLRENQRKEEELAALEEEEDAGNAPKAGGKRKAGSKARNNTKRQKQGDDKVGAACHRDSNSKKAQACAASQQAGCNSLVLRR